VSALVLYDDARARRFEPFVLTRPVSELRAGTTVIRQRWEHAFLLNAAGTIAASHLADFEELDAPPAASGTLAAGTLVANSRCVPALGMLDEGNRADAGAGVWRCNGRVAAVRLTDAVEATEFADGALSLDTVASHGTSVDIDGWWLEEVWDLIRLLTPQLTDDIGRLHRGSLDFSAPSSDVPVLGRHPVLIESGATVDPYVVFDASDGPVLVESGARLHSFTRVCGPCYIGRGTSVLGDKIANCSIGEACRIRGEISSSIVLGHTNKSHDGFVGHSYLGRWVNLGAGTITSNLKNTYGTVGLWTTDGIRDTGLQFLGSLIGDHAKTGIGVRLTTGTVVGAGANVYGSSMPPKYVPPFAWGDGEPYDIYAFDKFVTVAERAMARRQVPLGARTRRQLAAAYARRASDAGVPA
jgi:UDP-N-acetylglucosamine diphosphorylase / glucose-1-phosphate thymidylyltransferase / UDP-N-acetylgalactosamine diphosphorylase / glucosamine-1-phosphate N-acetyltransferase / galactosamine-1-phosphate N-acetyltransferase